MAKKEQSQVTYKATIIDQSPHITKFQAIMMKDTAGAIQLGDITETGETIRFRPVGWITLHVENSKSDDGEYDQYVFIDDDRNTYVTGSASFKKSFDEIMESLDDMEEGEIPADWAIKVFAKDSKNYKGKKFLSCSLVIGAKIKKDEDLPTQPSNGEGWTDVPEGI